MTTATMCVEWRCRRPVTGDDGRCSPHRAGAKRREKNEQERRERSNALHKNALDRQAREDYARTWREQNPTLAYTQGHECQLCGKVVQSTYAEAPPRSDNWWDRYHRSTPYDVEKAHQAEHGAAWAEFWAQEGHDE